MPKGSSTVRKPSLEELMAEHAEIYKKFLPTLTAYSEMAKKALELQVEIFKTRLHQDVTTNVLTLALVASISARKTPAELGQVIDALATKEIKVERVIYDPMNFNFYLFAQP